MVEQPDYVASNASCLPVQTELAMLYQDLID